MYQKKNKVITIDLFLGQETYTHWFIFHVTILSWYLKSSILSNYITLSTAGYINQ